MEDPPVQLAQEDAPWFWRLRETQALKDWLEAWGKSQPLITSAAMRAWLAEQPATVWWNTLAEAIDAYELQTGGAELPWQHPVEWLVEWGRKLRRRQRGLLLASAHRVKGLEFRHVAILDGNWERRNANEDPDAPRRLFYVAATRAQETLALAQMGAEHALLRGLPDMDAVQKRRPIPLPPPDPRLSREYRLLTPADVDLGFAGRHRPGHRIHAAIAALTPGAPLGLKRKDDRWMLIDAAGNTVGRLARRFDLPPGRTPEAVTVHAILVRYRTDSEPEYQHTLRCDRWEVVLPELVLVG